MTREEAIKRIHRFVETYKICGKDNYNPTTNITKLDYEAFKSAIESLKQMESISNKSEILTGWIPCSERLPQDEQKVLVTTRSGNLIDVEFYHASAFWKHYVIAWMPLPEPYRESEE
jgi:hypothetical protein